MEGAIMKAFEIGDGVYIRTDTRDITFDDELAALRDDRIIGTVENVFEDGDLSVRFVDGTPYDAVHWFKASQLEPATDPRDIEIASLRAEITLTRKALLPFAQAWKHFRDTWEGDDFDKFLNVTRGEYVRKSYETAAHVLDRKR